MPKPNIEFESLGTHWWIEILDDEPDADVERLILKRIRAFHDDYSRFIPKSFIGRLNTMKSLKNPPQELVDMLIFARDMFTASEGIFNISVSSTLGQLGYGTADAKSRIHTSLWDHVTMSNREITIPENVEIDLGGFGKGWIIDEIGKILRDNNRPHFIINGGGDILVSSLEPIEIVLEHPLDSSLMIGSTKISHGALGVSSTKKRIWKQGDITYHHIIDPRIKAPSESDIAATFVKADTALIADTLATVLLIDPTQDIKLTKAYALQTILIREDQLAST
jgi:thiamine biosynthesis lipoprotein